MGGYNPKFDLDLRLGEAGENWVKWLGVPRASVYLEVKLDKKYPDTGNVAIEYEFRGRPSGIMATEASFWIQLLCWDGIITGGFIIPVTKLRSVCLEVIKAGGRNGMRLVQGGDNNESKMVLIPLAILGRMWLS